MLPSTSAEIDGATSLNHDRRLAPCMLKLNDTRLSEIVLKDSPSCGFKDASA